MCIQMGDLPLGRRGQTEPQRLKQEGRIIFTGKTLPSQLRVRKQKALPKQMGLISPSHGESCQEAAGWERPRKHWFNPSVLPPSAGMLQQHPCLWRPEVPQGSGELPGDCSSPRGSPGSPSLAPPELPCRAAEVPGRFPSSVEDLCSLCWRARSIWSSKTKWEAAGKMQPGLLNGAQRDGERQQQELEQGKFPVNGRTNQEGAQMLE